MAALLRPISFREATVTFLAEHENLTKDTKMTQLDFVNLAHLVVECWSKDENNPDLRKEKHRQANASNQDEYIDDVPVSGTAESFSEMAVESAVQGDLQQAIVYQRESVSIRPRDKVSHRVSDCKAALHQ